MYFKKIFLVGLIVFFLSLSVFGSEIKIVTVNNHAGANKVLKNDKLRLKEFDVGSDGVYVGYLYGKKTGDLEDYYPVGGKLDLVPRIAFDSLNAFFYRALDKEPIVFSWGVGDDDSEWIGGYSSTEIDWTAYYFLDYEDRFTKMSKVVVVCVPNSAKEQFQAVMASLGYWDSEIQVK